METVLHAFGTRSEAKAFVVKHTCVAIQGETMIRVYGSDAQPVEPAKFEVYELVEVKP